MNNRQRWAQAVEARIPHSTRMVDALESGNFEVALSFLQELARGYYLNDAITFVRWHVTKSEAWHLVNIARAESLSKLRAGELLQVVFKNVRPNRELRDWLAVCSAVKS